MRFEWDKNKARSDKAEHVVDFEPALLFGILDQQVVDFFVASGPGWQTRINAALRKAAGLK